MKLMWFHLMPYTELPEDFREAHERMLWTAHHWRHWLARGCLPDHRWRGHLTRSALTIKVTGDTTSLPSNSSPVEGNAATHQADRTSLRARRPDLPQTPTTGPSSLGLRQSATLIQSAPRYR